MSAGNIVRPPEPDPYEEELRAFWRSVGRELVRDSVKTVDEVGRQLIGVAGVLVGLYVNAVAFGDLRQFTLAGWQVFLYLLPVLLLLFSLLFSGGMFFLERYEIDLRSSEGVKAILKDVRRTKLLFLRTAMVLLLLAVLTIAGALWQYLSAVQP